MKNLVVPFALLAALAAHAEPTAPPAPQLDLGGPTADDPPLDLGQNDPPAVEVPADADAPGIADPGDVVTDGVGDGLAPPSPPPAEPPPPPAEAEQFTEPLSPYGTWGYYDGVGYSFRPTVDAGWEPYTVGHWGADALWISDEPFGWACFHYGRWALLDGVWLWVPGSVWGPSWVSWNNYGGYVGWAPLMVYGYGGYNYVDRAHFYDRHVDHALVPHVVHHTQQGAAVHHFGGATHAAPSAQGIARARPVPITRFRSDAAPHRMMARPSSVPRSFAPHAPSRQSSSSGHAAARSTSRSSGHASSGHSSGRHR